MRRLLWVTLFVLAVSFAGSANAADGRAIFMSKCKNCHGEDRMGGTLAPQLKGTEFIKGNAEEIKNTILTGRTGAQKRYRHLPMSMPRFTFTVEELDAIVSFLKDDLGSGSGAVGMDGAVIYANKCKMCHMHEGRGGSMAPKLAASHFIRGDADAVKDVILSGRSGTQKHSTYPMSMPKFRFSDAELDALVEYLQSL